MWEENRAPGGNPHRHRENMQGQIKTLLCGDSAIHCTTGLSIKDCLINTREDLGWWGLGVLGEKSAAGILYLWEEG